MKTDVIIPTYRPGRELCEVLRRLSAQTVLPEHISIVNTGEEYWNPEWEKQFPLLDVRHIRKEDFDHGGTRREAAERSGADILVFMTQDAVPAGRDLLEKLTAPIKGSPDIAAAYARQRPKKGSGVIERRTRAFNYPSVSCVRHLEDTDRYGIKTFFCSNVCAAYRKSSYLAADGFPERTIFNEDMIMASRLMHTGFGVAYAAEAEVYHSHNYTPAEQFRRNFDIGVSQAEHPEVFGGIRSEGEGLRLVRETAGYLVSNGHPGLLPELFIMSAAKYAGYSLGSRYGRLPLRLIRACTFNKDYWSLSQI